MLLYKSHRFHCNGASFEIPDGFYFDSETGDDTPNQIKFVAPDEYYEVEIRVEEDCDGTDEELASVIHDLSPEVVYPIAPLLMNGLAGHHVTYRNRRTQYYEARFALADGTSQLMVLASTAGDILNVDTAALMAGVDPRAE